MPSNKKIIIFSVALGVGIVIAITGSLWLLTKNSHTENVTIETKSVQRENEQPTPEPTVVTVDTLSPEELARLWIQMWYGRDFAGMYSILDEQLQQTESPAAFIQRMQLLPVLTAIKINATKRTDATEFAATITLSVDGKTNQGTLQRDLVFGFRKTDGQWKIAATPDIATLDKK